MSGYVQAPPDLYGALVRFGPIAASGLFEIHTRSEIMQSNSAPTSVTKLQPNPKNSSWKKKIVAAATRRVRQPEKVKIHSTRPGCPEIPVKGMRYNFSPKMQDSFLCTPQQKVT